MSEKLKKYKSIYTKIAIKIVLVIWLSEHLCVEEHAFTLCFVSLEISYLHSINCTMFS